MKSQEMIDVIAAFERGEEIECTFKEAKEQWFLISNPRWDFYHYDYRVKPKTPEYIWVKETEQGHHRLQKYKRCDD